MPAPPLTVAIAAYDAEQHVAAAVRSALAQVPPPVEVVVVDDASTDGTAAVLAGFGDAVRVLRHPVNRGEAAAKNTAVRAARTEHVVLLDADDEFLPGRLHALGQRWAQDPEVDVLTTDALLVQGERVVGRWYGETNPLPRADQRVDVLSRNPVFGHPALRRTAFLAVGGFDEGLRHATDWDCWLRMVLNGSRVDVVAEPLSRYRLHDASASSSRAAMLAGNVALLSRALARDDLRPTERAAAEAARDERQRRLDRARLKAALVAGTGARPHARAVVADPRQPARSRVLALGCLVAPGPAALARRWAERRWWTGPGGVRLRRAA